MGADKVLVQGARDAYKNRDAAGMKAAGEGLDKITTSINAWAAKKKTEKEEFDKELQKEQQALTTKVTEMAPHHKALGKDAFEVYKEDVRGLRSQMEAALGPPRDEDAIMDINMKLAEMKSNSVKDKDGFEAIIQGWEPDPQTGEPAWDTKAMTPEGRDAHRNFIENPTRKFTRTEDGQSAYTWNKMDKDGNFIQKKTPAGKPMTNEYGEPMYESETYTLDELNDFTVLPQTENAKSLMDYTLEKQELYSSTGGEGNVKVQDVRKKVQEIIPKDAAGLRSWAKSNPTGDHKLDVEGYLVENISRIGNYKELGVKDISGPDGVKDGKFDHHDLVSVEDRENFFNAIMNADNPSITHQILSEMMTNVTYNKITNREDKNTDFNPGSNIMMDGSTGKTEEDMLEERTGVMEKLTALSDPENLKQYVSLTEEQIANKIGIDPKAKILNPETGQTESVSTYIANAKDKAASTGKTAEDYKNMLVKKED